MTGKEWSEYFESINGRKPSEKEFSTAKAAGKFNTEELPPAGTALKQSNQKKKKRWLLPTIIVAAVLISAAVGTFAYLKMTANPFDGTWYSKEQYGYNSRLTFKGNKIELLFVGTPQTTSYGGSIQGLSVLSIVLNTQDKTVQIDTGDMDNNGVGGHEKSSGTFSENDEELESNIIIRGDGFENTITLSKDKTLLQLKKGKGGEILEFYKSDTSQASQAKSFFEKYSSQIQQLKLKLKTKME